MLDIKRERDLEILRQACFAYDKANQQLLDNNGDGGVDLSDAVALFAYLFLGGPPPVLGRDCVAIPDCRDSCTP